MARALRFQLHDRLAATVASPRIRSGRGRPLCSGWVIRLETKAGWVGLVPRALTRCPRERRRSESNRRIEVLQTSVLLLGYVSLRDTLASFLEFFNLHRDRSKTLHTFTHNPCLCYSANSDLYHCV